jgi:hypothetical protein
MHILCHVIKSERPAGIVLDVARESVSRYLPIVQHSIASNAIIFTYDSSFTAHGKEAIHDLNWQITALYGNYFVCMGRKAILHNPSLQPNRAMLICLRK